VRNLQGIIANAWGPVQSFIGVVGTAWTNNYNIATVIIAVIIIVAIIVLRRES
jgi:hypothetical protein